jgi:hypothetical protein
MRDRSPYVSNQALPAATLLKKSGRSGPFHLTVTDIPSWRKHEVGNP